MTSKCDPSLFVYTNGKSIAYLLLYVDDIILTSSTQSLLDEITSLLKKEFHITYMGRLNNFLGVKIEYNVAGMLLSQGQYARDIITRADMSECKLVATPVDVNSK